MTALDARKQILIAESGIHRALLDRDLEEMAAAAQALVEEGKKAAKLAASGALLLGAGLAFARGRGERPSRHPMLRTFLDMGLRTLPLWIEVFRAARRENTPDDKNPVGAEPAPGRK